MNQRTDLPARTADGHPPDEPASQETHYPGHIPSVAKNWTVSAHLVRCSDEYIIGFVFTVMVGLIFAALSINAAESLESRSIERQEAVQTGLTAQQAVLANTTFVRDVAIRGSELKPFQSLELTGANLSGLPLGCTATPRECRRGGAAFTEANLSQARFFRADLRYAQFQGADLTGASLIGADLTNADLTEADLTNADLREANLTNVNFTDADLTGANLTEADLRGANLANNADLTDAYLTNADLTGAGLIGADLTGADLTNADLTGADLTNADLTGADLTDADLTNADLTGANLTNAELTNATIDR